MMSRDRYPLIFRCETGAMSLIGGPPGWQHVLQRLFGELEEIVRGDIEAFRYVEADALVVRQVKSQFGELVVHSSGIRTAAIDERIRCAHEATSRTCEMCGAHAEGDQGGMQVRCSQHAGMAWHKFLEHTDES